MCVCVCLYYITETGLRQKKSFFVDMPSLFTFVTLFINLSYMCFRKNYACTLIPNAKMSTFEEPFILIKDVIWQIP